MPVDHESFIFPPLRSGAGPQQGSLLKSLPSSGMYVWSFLWWTTWGGGEWGWRVFCIFVFLFFLAPFPPPTPPHFPLNPISFLLYTCQCYDLVASLARLAFWSAHSCGPVFILSPRCSFLFMTPVDVLRDGRGVKEKAAGSGIFGGRACLKYKS